MLSGILNLNSRNKEPNLLLGINEADIRYEDLHPPSVHLPGTKPLGPSAFYCRGQRVYRRHTRFHRYALLAHLFTLGPPTEAKPEPQIRHLCGIKTHFDPYAPPQPLDRSPSFWRRDCIQLVADLVFDFSSDAEVYIFTGT